jgi:hypothetical protein
LAHLHKYQGVFSDIVAVYKKELARLPPSNWSRSCWQRYRMQKVDAKYLTDYLIIDDNPLLHTGMHIANYFSKTKLMFWRWSIITSYIFHKVITLCVWRPYKC